MLVVENDEKNKLRQQHRKMLNEGKTMNDKKKEERKKKTKICVKNKS
jgi:hypothetical protein